MWVIYKRNLNVFEQLAVAERISDFLFSAVGKEINKLIPPCFNNIEWVLAIYNFIDDAEPFISSF